MRGEGMADGKGGGERSQRDDSNSKGQGQVAKSVKWHYCRWKNQAWVLIKSTKTAPCLIPLIFSLP